MMKADGMPLDMAKSLYNNMKFHWTSSADGVKWTEYLGNGSKDTFCAKFDEEFEKPNPFPGAPATKVVTSKLGNGKYKVIMKEPTKGMVYDITEQFYDGGVISVSHI